MLARLVSVDEGFTPRLRKSRVATLKVLLENKPQNIPEKAENFPYLCRVIHRSSKAVSRQMSFRYNNFRPESQLAGDVL